MLKVLGLLVVILHASFVLCSEKRGRCDSDDDIEEIFGEGCSSHNSRHCTGPAQEPDVRMNQLMRKFSSLDVSLKEELIDAVRAENADAFLGLCRENYTVLSGSPQLQQALLSEIISTGNTGLLRTIMVSFRFLLSENVVDIFAHALTFDQQELYAILYLYQPCSQNLFSLAVRLDAHEAWLFMLACKKRSANPEQVCDALMLADILYNDSDQFITSFSVAENFDQLKSYVLIALLNRFETLERQKLRTAFSVLFKLHSSLPDAHWVNLSLYHFRNLLNRAAELNSKLTTSFVLALGARKDYLNVFVYFSPSGKASFMDCRTIISSTRVSAPWVIAAELGHVNVLEVYSSLSFAKESFFYGVILKAVKQDNFVVLKFMFEHCINFLLAQELQQACYILVDKVYSTRMLENEALAAFQFMTNRLPRSCLKASDGTTFLYQAAIRGKIEMMRFLVEQLECPVDEPVTITSANSTITTFALFGALKSNSTAPLELLLLHNVNIFVKTTCHYSTFMGPNSIISLSAFESATDEQRNALSNSHQPIAFDHN